MASTIATNSTTSNTEDWVFLGNLVLNVSMLAVGCVIIKKLKKIYKMKKISDNSDKETFIFQKMHGTADNLNVNLFYRYNSGIDHWRPTYLIKF